ncbi:hypothetical protein GXY_08200 [Novacetimonas hansenii ATCC 23769]|uniref:Uncharacterized protein n=1 Tax=Novacetimonas hansenii ATCC 23769 TaxID=714995 RepID=D5QES5_NOVHA|nr:hypothetical protein GXY_08200 [Novacetimonas hansenii ATCC 23769]
MQNIEINMLQCNTTRRIIFHVADHLRYIRIINVS